ncbi:rhodanese-like domain-containing protein [Streptomyces griseus]|uniref:rhodanese-like domain-containing protein n=1 Tax=Streptomyces griseus TaxID=1911 RepID=UPI0036473396
MFLFNRKAPRLSVHEARGRTGGERPESVLLDVREKPEWRAGHAPDALHAPLTGLAAKLLAERGADAVDVEGGMNAWAAAGYPVVDERGNSGSIA